MTERGKGEAEDASPLLDSDSDENEAPPLVDSEEDLDDVKLPSNFRFSTPPRSSTPSDSNTPGSGGAKRSPSSFGANLESLLSSFSFVTRESPNRNNNKENAEGWGDGDVKYRNQKFAESKYSATQASFNIANKDEAERAYDEGLKHYQNGSYEQALNFLRRSVRLYPTNDSQRMLDQATIKLAEQEQQKERQQEEERRKKEQQEEEEKRKEEQAKHEKEKEKEKETGAASTGAGKKEEQPTTQNVKSEGSWFTSFFSSKTTTTTTTETAEGVTYTTEQLEGITRVTQCNDHYEVLGVTRTASSSEIKKAYFKLALKLHPDKNTAPGAQSAFHDLQTAYDTLYDEEQRAKYDGKLESMARRGGVGDGRQKERQAQEEVANEAKAQLFFGMKLKDLPNLWRLIYRLPVFIFTIALRWCLVLLQVVLLYWKRSTWTSLYYTPFRLSWVIVDVLFVTILALTLFIVKLPWTWKTVLHVIYRLLISLCYFLVALAADRRPPGATRDRSEWAGGEGVEGEADDYPGASSSGHSQEELPVWEDNGKFYCSDPYGNEYDVTGMIKNMLRDQQRGREKDFSYYQERWPPTPRKYPNKKQRYTKSTARYRPEEYAQESPTYREETSYDGGKGRRRKGKKGRRGKKRI